MSASSFDEALRRLLVHEGGYSNHPSDPGGPTNFGITLRDYRKYVKPNATASDVRTMKLAEAKAIYRSKYWDALRCDQLPAGVDYAVFDYGVNSGIGRSGKVLRRVLGLADDTHVVTPAVIAAVHKSEPRDLVLRISAERLRFLKALRTWPVFGNGWARRVEEVKSAALRMTSTAGAGHSTQGQPVPAPGKAITPLERNKQKGSTGAVVATGTVAAQQAHAAGLRPWVIVLIILVTVALAFGAWSFWRWRQRRQHEIPV
jgi:lysozyme family protein